VSLITIIDDLLLVCMRHLSAKSFKLLLVLYQCCNDRGYVGINELAGVTGYSKNTVRKYVCELAEWEIVAVGTEVGLGVRKGSNAKIVAINSAVICSDKWKSPLYHYSFNMVLDKDRFGAALFAQHKVAAMINEGILSGDRERYAESIVQSGADNGGLTKKQVFELKRIGVRI
jgi:hypothetical protein